MLEEPHKHSFKHLIINVATVWFVKLSNEKFYNAAAHTKKKQKLCITQRFQQCVKHLPITNACFV